MVEDGVVEGRKVFCNILNYVRIGASSNFGNMLSGLKGIASPSIPSWNQILQTLRELDLLRQAVAA